MLHKATEQTLHNLTLSKFILLIFLNTFCILKGPDPYYSMHAPLFLQDRAKRLLLVFLLLTIVLLPLASAPAQDYSYLHYTTRDGLAGSNVHGISQDRDGFLWFSTETGLSRFDGKQFRNFTMAEGLPSNEVLATLCDSRNRLWIMSFKNALCYHYKGKIYNPHNDPSLEQIKISSYVIGIAETENSEILINTTKGFYLISPEDKITFIPRSNASSGKARYYPVVRSLGEMPAEILPHSIQAFVVDSIVYEDKRETPTGLLYALSTPKSVIITPADTAKKIIIPYPNWVRQEFYNDSIFILSRNPSGLYFYDFKNKKFIREYLPKAKVQDFFEDREGNFWFSTKGTGVFKLGPWPFVTYIFGQRERPFSVYQIYAGSNGSIQVITEHGRYWQFRPLKKDPAGGLLPFSNPAQMKTVINQLRSKPNTLLHFMDANLDDLIPPLYSYHLLIKTIFYYNDTLLIASAGGAYRLSLKQPHTLDTLCRFRATCALKFRDSIYIGSLNGLYKYAGRKLQYLGMESPLLRNRINTIAPGTDSMLWVGTYENGVAGLKDGKVVIHLDKRSGLPDNTCNSLFPERQYLWVGTEQGIGKIDLSLPNPRVVAWYDKADGLQAAIVNTIYVDSPIVYVGTQDGITCFDESRVPRHGPCNILFTGISVAGRQVVPDTGKNIAIAHRDNNIRFEYAGLSFLSAGNITYRYRLVGLSDKWQTTTQMYLDYPSLPSGNYKFQILAINKFGDKSSLLEQQFSIAPLLWERAGVQLLTAGLLIVLIAILFQLRLRSLRRKDHERQILQREIATLEQKALRAQMSPHFIFNCLNSIQHFILTNDARNANRYLNKFATLVRSTLEHAPHMYIPLSAEITYLTSYLDLEHMQAPTAFTYTITTDPAIETEQVIVPNMMLQPFLENAIKHGVSQLSSGGEITLSFHQNAGTGMLSCIISDNGPGMGKAAKQQQEGHNSRGINITRERLAILNQVLVEGKISLNIISPAAGDTGTKIILSLPVLYRRHE